MTREEVAERVQADLDSFTYVEKTREEAGTLGIPWSAKRVGEEMELLKKALVTPELIQVIDFDTLKAGKRLAKWWLVAQAEGFNLVLYDPECNQFALAIGDPQDNPKSVCVRGDLCSTFMAR